MDDLTIADLGFIWGRVIYDDSPLDEPQIVRKNQVKAAQAHMGTLAREHIDWPFEAIANYDY